MDMLVRQGKVLYWGTSEWPADAIRTAHRVARANHLAAPQMEQPQYNLFDRERVEVEYAPLYRELGLGTTIWSPLASGLLTGKYNDGIPKGSRMDTPGYEWLRRNLTEGDGPAKIEKARKLAAIAREFGVPLSQLALAWCLRNRNVSTVMLGATKAEQLEENLGALDVFGKLKDADFARIEAVVA